MERDPTTLRARRQAKIATLEARRAELLETLKTAENTELLRTRAILASVQQKLRWQHARSTPVKDCGCGKTPKKGNNARPSSSSAAGA